jgi:hypothetical protein
MRAKKTTLPKMRRTFFIIHQTVRMNEPETSYLPGMKQQLAGEELLPDDFLEIQPFHP